MLGLVLEKNRKTNRRISIRIFRGPWLSNLSLIFATPRLPPPCHTFNDPMLLFHEMTGSCDSFKTHKITPDLCKIVLGSFFTYSWSNIKCEADSKTSTSKGLDGGFTMIFVLGFRFFCFDRCTFSLNWYNHISFQERHREFYNELM